MARATGNFRRGNERSNGIGLVGRGNERLAEPSGRLTQNSQDIRLGDVYRGSITKIGAFMFGLGGRAGGARVASSVYASRMRRPAAWMLLLGLVVLGGG